MVWLKELNMRYKESVFFFVQSLWLNLFNIKTGTYKRLLNRSGLWGNRRWCF